MNRFFIVCLTVAGLALPRTALADGLPPVEGCMNSWVSNGTWALRVTKVQNSADRFDVWVVYRNGTAKTLRLLQNPDGTIGLTGGFLGYRGDDPEDTLGEVETFRDHPERLTQLSAQDPKAPLKPGATFRKVVRFYYPDYWKTALRARKPILYSQANGTDNPAVAELHVKLTCTK